jgi:NDP-sugar pyrophosphorylase family protein
VKGLSDCLSVARPFIFWSAAARAAAFPLLKNKRVGESGKARRTPKLLNMRAMILAAGYGTRLYPLTADRTKPAIPLLGKPLVGYVAEYLAGYGFNDVVVNLHHRPESVRKALGDGSRFGVRLHYVEEKEILGTSGALDNAKELLTSDTFAVVNGKIVTDIDLSKALETHKKSNAIATLILLPNYKREKFTVVNVKDGLLVGFGGMPETDSPSDNKDDLSLSYQKEIKTESAIGNRQSAVPLMFTGIQFLEPGIFDYIPRGVFSHSTTDVYPKAIENGELVAVHIAEGQWYELSTIRRYLEISLLLNEGRNNGVIYGERDYVSENAFVEDSILWDDVMIEKGSVVRNSILGDGVVIESNSEIENAAIVRAELIAGEEPPAKALRGKFVGENFVVPLTQ